MKVIELWAVRDKEISFCISTKKGTYRVTDGFAGWCEFCIDDVANMTVSRVSAGAVAGFGYSIIADVS